MKYTKILLALMLTSQLAFSQEDYPKKTVVGSDTLVLITIPQLTKINHTYLRLDYQHEIARNLSQENGLLKSLIDNNDKLMENIKAELAVKDSIASELDLQVEELESKNRGLDRKLKLAKLSGNSKMLIGGGIGAYVMYLFQRYVVI